MVKRYGGRAVVDRIDIQVGRGETVVVVGPSGSGKSTLLRLLSGLEARDGGELRLFGRDVRSTPRSSRDIGFVFQNYLLFPHLTVAANLAYPLRRQRLSRAEVGRRVAEALERVGLQQRAGSYPEALSGGERQRVALMRAVIHRPLLLVLDEPFSALDVGLAQDMQDGVFETARERAAGTVLVTHDPQFALAVADRLLLLRAGRPVQQGTPREVWDCPASPFAAGFFGRVATLDVTVRAPAGAGQPVPVDLGGCVVTARAVEAVSAGPGRLVVRAEAVAVDGRDATLRGRVERVQFHGSELTARITLDGAAAALDAKLPPQRPVGVGEAVSVGWAWQDGLLYPPGSDDPAEGSPDGAG